MLESAKNMIAKTFDGYIVIIVMMNFRKYFSIMKIFPSRFPEIFVNSSQRKIILVYSIGSQSTV